MITMNPYYARTSSIGVVFDVATISPRKAVTGAVFGFLLGTAMAAAAVHLYSPTLLPMPDAQWIAQANSDLVEARKTHPHAVNAGIATMGVLDFIFLATALASAVDATNRDYYFRAGPAGFSVRVRNGVALSKLGFGFNVLQLDLSWEEIEKWTLVQEKQLSAIYERNVSAYVKLKTKGGKKYAFCLDSFQESGEFIWRKLQDAMEMVPARLGESSNAQNDSSDSQAWRAVTRQEKHNAISASLENLLAQTSQDKSSVLSDAASGKFLQFACNNGSILLDLPAQPLTDAEWLRASDYFSRLGHDLQEYDLFDHPGGCVATAQRSYQLKLANDVARAIQVAMDLFSEVFQLPAEFELVVEEI